MNEHQKQEFFEYLDELRDSAVTNMYGAAPYIMEEFHTTKQEARSILLAWMAAVDNGSHDCRS